MVGKKQERRKILTRRDNIHDCVTHLHSFPFIWLPCQRSYYYIHCHWKYWVVFNERPMENTINRNNHNCFQIGYANYKQPYIEEECGNVRKLPMRRTPSFVLRRIFLWFYLRTVRMPCQNDPSSSTSLFYAHRHLVDECTRHYEKYSHLDFSAIFGLLVWVEIPVGIFHLSTLVVVRRVNIHHTNATSTQCLKTILHTIHVYAIIVLHCEPLSGLTLLFPQRLGKMTIRMDIRLYILLHRFVSKLTAVQWVGVCVCVSLACVHSKLIQCRSVAKMSVRNFPLIILFYSCK